VSTAVLERRQHVEHPMYPLSRTAIDGIAMTNDPKPEYPHRRPHSPPLDGRYLELDLRRELDQLQRVPLGAR